VPFGERLLQAGDGFALGQVRQRSGGPGAGGRLLRHEMHEPLRERLTGLE
jgi:hypothetical protein